MAEVIENEDGDQEEEEEAGAGRLHGPGAHGPVIHIHCRRLYREL